MITNRKQAFARLYAACMDSSVYAFLASTGITETSKIVAINDLVINLKMYGLWNKMKAIYPFVSDTRNTFNYSSTFTTGWLGQNTSTVIDINGPLGIPSYKVTTTSSSFCQIYQSAPIKTGTYTYQIWVKTISANAINIRTGAGVFIAGYDFTSNTTSNCTRTDLGSGWNLIKFTYTSPSDQEFGLYLSNGIAGPYVSTTGAAILLNGVQGEAGTVATAYQRIVTTTADRFVSQFKYNLKDPRNLDAAFRLAFSGTWTYSQQGALPNGVNAYANTYLNPTTVGFTQTNTHLSAYLRTDTNGTKVDIGGSYNLFMGVRWANNYNFPINRSNNAVGTSSSSIGYFLASRVDNVRDRMFKNGTNVTNFTGAAVSLDNQNIYISATNGGGLYSDRQTAFNTIGYGLTDTEVQNLYSCIQLFQTALNRYIGNPIAKVSDVDAQTFVTTAGIYNQTQANAINTLVTDLKGYGIWSKMKAIYPFVSDTYNLTSYTEDFDNWGKTAATVSVNTIVAPDGTTTADKIIPNTTNTSHSVSSSIISVTSGIPYTRSVYVKKGEYSNVVLSIGGFSAYNDWKYVAFNLDTNTFTAASSSTTYTSTIIGNGWVRLSFTVTPTSTNNDRFFIIVSNNPNNTSQNPSFAGDGTSGIYLWGAQWEQASSASTYQPIATTPANRFVSQFKYNLKDARDLDAAFRLAFNGTWTYDKMGATPNGTNAYANTYLTPSASLGSTFSLSYYSNLDILATATNTCEIGVFQSGSQMMGLSLRRNLNSDLFSADGYGQSAISTSTNSNFFGITSRSSTTSLKIWKNNTLTATNTTTDTGSKPTNPINLALNNGLTGYSNRRCAFAHIGDGLSDTEVADLYTAVQKFNTTLTRNN